MLLGVPDGQGSTRGLPSASVTTSTWRTFRRISGASVRRTGEHAYVNFIEFIPLVIEPRRTGEIGRGGGGADLRVCMLTCLDLCYRAVVEPRGPRTSIHDTIQYNTARNDEIRNTKPYKAMQCNLE